MPWKTFARPEVDKRKTTGHGCLLLQGECTHYLATGKAGRSIGVVYLFVHRDLFTAEMFLTSCWNWTPTEGDERDNAQQAETNHSPVLAENGSRAAALSIYFNINNIHPAAPGNLLRGKTQHRFLLSLSTLIQGEITDLCVVRKSSRLLLLLLRVKTQTC